MPPNEPMLTDQELADHLGVSIGLVHKMRRAGMPSHLFGRCRRYLRSEALAWSAATYGDAA